MPGVDSINLGDVASVVGSKFDADVVARSVGCDLEAALASLERIAAAGLVHTVPGRPGQFAFTHALFRRARYDSIPPRTRLVIHRDVAATLAARLPADEAILPELARHASIAAPPGNAPEAVDYATLAAARAERSLGLGEAATHYRRALQVAAMIEGPQPDLTFEAGGCDGRGRCHHAAQEREDGRPIQRLRLPLSRPLAFRT